MTLLRDFRVHKWESSDPALDVSHSGLALGIVYLFGTKERWRGGGVRHDISKISHTTERLKRQG